jgi:polar amino acid transport system substrate-binding protein
MSCRTVVLTICLTTAGLAHAGCSRPIVVPASPLGKAIIVVDERHQTVAGIYPELLREYGKKAGCEFVFPVVPRVRAEAMVRAGQADLLMGAMKVADRDHWGDFAPLMASEWMLVSMRGDAPPRSVQELLARPNIMVNVVRSFNYGPDYLAMLAALEGKKELEYVKDPATVVRKMAAGRVDYTFMPSNTFAGALDELGLKKSLGPKVRYSRLAGMRTALAGMYLSRQLDPRDAAQVAALLDRMRADGAVVVHMRQFFTPEEMSSSTILPTPVR